MRIIVTIGAGQGTLLSVKYLKYPVLSNTNKYFEDKSTQK